MNIAGRSGHTDKASGSVGLINETVEAKKVFAATCKYLKQLGHNVVDVTPPQSYAYPAELNYGINKANQLNVDLFFSIHFNNAYSKYNGSLGTETLAYRSNPYATRVNANLSGLGFKNRGVKIRPRPLGELDNTKMTAIIIEVCFVEATEDVALYKKLGPDAIGKAIAEGIANKKVTAPSQPPTTSQPKPPSNGWKLVKQNGVCTWNTAVQIREQPSTKSKSVGQYSKGQKVTYDYYTDNEGYRWISWIGGSGKRRYAAVRVLSNNKKYGNCV